MSHNHTSLHTAPCFISVAPNGARRNKSDHPAIPLNASEIADEAAICRDAGAALLHLHVRDNNARHLLDADAYRAATNAVKDVVGDEMIIQITTEAAGIYERPQQMAVVRDLHPEAVSLAVREMVSREKDELEAASFFHWMNDEGILAQYILYSPDDVASFVRMKKNGIIPDSNVSVLFVLGSYAGDESDPEKIQSYVDVLADEKISWAVCGFGKGEAAVAERAVALGGHPRVGFENNIYTQDGLVAKNNAALVAQIAQNIKKSERVLADSAYARKLLAGKILQ
ncbi:MAG: 3-keto-5-aminohexanoate cleavage protein [Rhodospirillaceae bacterium]|nr:3-keto-5-aminohexanoate cleavage protein [Rhodospirillaceae bacterium]